MRFLFVLCYLFFSLSTNVFAATSDQEVVMEKIRKTLLKHQEVHGNFKQVRSLKDPKLDLESEGMFKFKLPMDLSWNQTKPFALDLLMSPDKIVQKTAGGDEQVITKAQQPVVFIFSSSFMGIFSGDKKTIEKTFAYQVSMTDKKWAVTLEPKDELLKKVILEVKINGREFVEKVEVREKSGNVTNITFANVKGT